MLLLIPEDGDSCGIELYSITTSLYTKYNT